MPMNYYHCYGFTEIDDYQQEVDILIANQDVNRARMISSWYITNISHFDNYPIDIKEFGNCQFIINHEGESVEIISALPTIKEGFRLLTNIGMDITAVNSLDTPLKPSLQKIIRGMLRKEFGLSNDDPFTTHNEDEDPLEGAELTPAQLIRITNLITNILNDSKELYVKAKGVIGGDSVALFAKMIEMLQNTLSQGDIMSAKEQTKKLISLMEQIEGEYLDFQKAHDHQVQTQITIPSLNTILANNQWVTADKLYTNQINKRSQVEQRYETLYQKIIKKKLIRWKTTWMDFMNTAGVRHTIINTFIKYIEYVLVFTSIIIVGLLRFNSHISYWSNILYIVGFAGCAIQVARRVKMKHPLAKIGVIFASFIVIGSIGYLLASNLALI